MEYKWAQADPVVPVHPRQPPINAFLSLPTSQWHEPSSPPSRSEAVPQHHFSWVAALASLELHLRTSSCVLPYSVPHTCTHDVVWTCLNLRCLNTSLVTELTICDVWQWSCLLAIRFTVEVLCLYFCRNMAKWLSANFAFLSATYCGVQWGNHTGGATSCIKYGLTAEVKYSKFYKIIRTKLTWRKDQKEEGSHLVLLMGH